MDTDKLWPGLVAAAPVRHPLQRDVELVMPGVALEDRMIANLRRLGVGAIWVRWPGLDFLDDVVHARILDLRDEVYQALKSDFETAQQITVGVGQYVQYCEMISNVTLSLLTGGQAGVGAHTAGLFDHGAELFRHAANVTYLSMTLGLRMVDYISRQRRHAGASMARDLTNLGVGAMLHDIGKLQLPGAQLHHEPLDGPPSPSYQQHPQTGYRMIRDRVSATVKAVVLHHHQRFDGRGFPDLATLVRHRRVREMKGRNIHIFPRIVHLIDGFEHLCYDEQGRARPPVAALHALVGEGLAGRYDPMLLAGLLRHVPPFAVGTQVTLSDGRQAAVIGLNRQSPCRPLVRLLDVQDPQRRDIDLLGQQDIHIVKALGVSVERWLFELPAWMARGNLHAVQVAVGL